MGSSVLGAASPSMDVSPSVVTVNTLGFARPASGWSQGCLASWVPRVPLYQSTLLAPCLCGAAPWSYPGPCPLHGTAPPTLDPHRCLVGRRSRRTAGPGLTYSGQRRVPHRKLARSSRILPACWSTGKRADSSRGSSDPVTCLLRSYVDLLRVCEALWTMWFTRSPCHGYIG